MKIQSEELIAAVEMLDHVPLRNGIQSSEFVRLTCKKATLELALASDLIGVAKIKVEDAEDFVFFVERKLFFPFLQAAKGKNKALSLAITDAGMVVKDGRRTGRWAPIDVMKGYSTASAAAEKVLQIPEDLISELRLAAKYASQDQLAPELSCVWIDAKAGEIYSTNKFSVFAAAGQTKIGGPLPAAFPDLLEAGSEVRVGDAGARIINSSGYLFQAFNSKSLEAFPKAALVKAMKGARSWPVRAILPAGKLLDMLSRLATYVAGSSSDETIIRVEAKAGDPLLRFRTGTSSGAFSESLKIAKAPTADWTADWLLVSIRPFLEAAGDKGSVSVSWEDTTPYFFADETSGRFLISPRKAK